MNNSSTNQLSHSPFLGHKAVALSCVFEAATVVQDYPKKNEPSVDRKSSARRKPRDRHSSYDLATSKQYLYGLRTKNPEQKNWTRLAMFKPSKKVVSAWGFKVGNSKDTSLVSFSFMPIPNSDNVIVRGHCSNQIIEADLAIIKSAELQRLESSLWNKELNEAL